MTQPKPQGGGHHGGHHGGGAREEAPTGGRGTVLSPPRDEPQVGLQVSHGARLATSAFLAGLAPFAALVWLPASRHSGVGGDAIRSFGMLAGGLLLALALAGVGELSSYAVLASGDP